MRDGRALRHAFEISSDYLRDADATPQEVNFADLGLQLTRTTRAFKLWLSLRTFGLDAFRASIDRCLDLAELARDRIEASEQLELAAPVSLGVVCFRRRPRSGDDDEWLTDGLVAALEQSGVGFISSTRVHGLPALRLCILNHTSTADDVERVIAFLESAEPVAAPAGYDPHADVGDSVPVFARLEAPEAELLATLSTELRVAAGDTIVARWETSRDFFVLEEGAVDVVIDDKVVSTLRAGEFFGEIAALEWGAGYARSRIATVVARRDVRLRVLEPAALARLLEAFPRLERELRLRRTTGSVSSDELRRRDPARARRRVPQPRAAPGSARVRLLQRSRVGGLDRDARVRLRPGRGDDRRPRGVGPARAGGALRSCCGLARRPAASGPGPRARLPRAGGGDGHDRSCAARRRPAARRLRLRCSSLRPP